MKKILFIISVVIFATFTSCSNESESIEKNRNPKYDFVMDEFILQNSEDYVGWMSSLQKNSMPTTRASVDVITLNGYSSKSSGGTRKVILGKELATRMQISNQIYIMETVTMNINIHIDGYNVTSLFASADSPLCGLIPNATKEDLYRRGYVVSSPDSNGNIRLSTRCVHVISDLSGTAYDMWYPCTPEEVQWRYNLIKL